MLRVDTWSHTQESDFRLSCLKISAAMTQIAPETLSHPILLEEKGYFKAHQCLQSIWSRAESRATPPLLHVSQAIVCVGVTVLTFITDDGC